jgi:hypothetical protein
VTEKQLYVRADREARAAWPEMSPEEREELQAALRIVRADRIEKPLPLVIFVLDEDLPANTVASIVEDPSNSGHPMLVFSRQTYSFAAWVMAAYVQYSKKANALFRQLGRLDVTASATIVDRDRNTLVELKLPPQSLWYMRDLTQVTTGATSSESVELPDMGRGQLYRFPSRVR